MRSATSRKLIAGLGVTLSGALLAHFLLTLHSSGDYKPSAPGADNAGPPLIALAHGRLDHFIHVQTVMGLGSLLWRLPFVAPTIWSGADAQTVYLVGAAACSLPLLGLIAWLLNREPSLTQIAGGALAACLMIAGPLTIEALQVGHPEEVFTATLVVAAVLAAQSNRRTVAALLFGVAIGSKEWALFAAPAVWIALPGGRRRAAALAAFVSGLLTAPLPLLDPAAFHRANAQIGSLRDIGTLSVWWPAHVVIGPGIPFGINRADAGFGGVAVALLGVLLLGRLLRARYPSRCQVGADPMALLALAGILRCIMDPGDCLYYFVAAVIPLAAWEVGTLRRLPVLTTMLNAVVGLCFTGTQPFNDWPAVLGVRCGLAVFLVFADLLAVYLALRTFMPTTPRLATMAERPQRGASARSGLAVAPD